MELLTLTIGSFYRWETFYILAYPVFKKSSTKIFKIFQKQFRESWRYEDIFILIILLLLYMILCVSLCVYKSLCVCICACNDMHGEGPWQPGEGLVSSSTIGVLRDRVWGQAWQQAPLANQSPPCPSMYFSLRTGDFTCRNWFPPKILFPWYLSLPSKPSPSSAIL